MQMRHEQVDTQPLRLQRPMARPQYQGRRSVPAPGPRRDRPPPTSPTSTSPASWRTRGEDRRRRTAPSPMHHRPSTAGVCDEVLVARSAIRTPSGRPRVSVRQRDDQPVAAQCLGVDRGMVDGGRSSARSIAGQQRRGLGRRQLVSPRTLTSTAGRASRNARTNQTAAGHVADPTHPIATGPRLPWAPLGPGGMRRRRHPGLRPRGAGRASPPGVSSTRRVLRTSRSTPGSCSSCGSAGTAAAGRCAGVGRRADAAPRRRRKYRR